MGNCCASPAVDKNDVRHKKSERVANWRATGVISLRGASLKELPAEVAQVTSPRVLDATDNHIERLPPSLPSSLQRLVLQNNRIADGSLASLAGLQNIKYLVLDGNRIGTLPDFIGRLARLETLSVADNLLAQLPRSLGQLHRLKQLLVAQNKLTALPEELGECGALEELDAHHNTLQVLPASLGNLHRLKLLQLDSNQIRTLPLAILLNCTSLTTISLHDNPITPASLHAIEGFAEFEARRQSKYTKTLATGVLLGTHGMDEGLDRPLAKRVR